MDDSLTALMEANPVAAITIAGALGCAVILWWRRRDTGLRLAGFDWGTRAKGPIERFWTAAENSAYARRVGAARGKAVGSSIGRHFGMVLDLLRRGAYALAEQPAPQPVFEQLFGLIGGLIGALIGGTIGGGYGAGHGGITGRSFPDAPYR